MPASMSGANVTFRGMRSRSRSTGITSSASATSRSRTASYARKATSRDSPGAARTASIASWTARPSETTALAAFPGRSGPVSWGSVFWGSVFWGSVLSGPVSSGSVFKGSVFRGSPSAVSGSGVLVSSASCATVLSLRIRTGDRTVILVEDIAGRPGISRDFRSDGAAPRAALYSRRGGWVSWALGRGRRSPVAGTRTVSAGARPASRGRSLRHHRPVHRPRRSQHRRSA
jgi:hypothetical protein